MKAEDTVMSDEQIIKAVTSNIRGTDAEAHLNKYHPVAKAQAQISFKAGYDQRESEFVYNPDYLDFKKGIEAGRTTGKQAGIREVVEWVLGWCEHTTDPLQRRYLCSACMRELKEWNYANNK